HRRGHAEVHLGDERPGLVLAQAPLHAADLTQRALLDPVQFLGRGHGAPYTVCVTGLWDCPQTSVMRVPPVNHWCRGSPSRRRRGKRVLYVAADATGPRPLRRTGPGVLPV